MQIRKNENSLQYQLTSFGKYGSIVIFMDEYWFTGMMRLQRDRKGSTVVIVDGIVGIVEIAAAIDAMRSSTCVIT